MALILLSSNGVFAEEKEDEPVTTMETMVIIGEREDPFHGYETGDVPLDEISAFSQVITREKFEGKVTDLATVIQKEAGIQIRRSGGIGSFSTVSIRGSTSEQVMVFIDGVLLNEASGGGVNLANISLSDVESIEIFRGTTPIQFGTASIGGVINIRTRRTVTTEKDLTLTATAGLGSFDTTQASFFLNHRLDKFDYLISADFLSSEGDFRYKNTKNAKDSAENYQWEHRYNNWLTKYNLLLKAGYNFSTDKRLHFSNEYFKKKQGLPYWNNISNVKTKLTTTRNIFIGKYVVDGIGSHGINSATRFQYSWKSELYDDRYGKMGLGLQLYEYNTEGFSVNQLFEVPLSDHLLTTVFDIKHETFEAVDKLNKRTYRPSWRTVFSGAVEDNILFFDEELSLIPCLRYHLIRDKRQNSDYSGGSEAEHAYISPKTGFLWRVNPWLRMKGNMGRYVREPSFLELFGDRGFFNGNAELEAEKGINRDLGLEAAFHPGIDSVVQNIKLGLVYFNNDVENLITFIYDARGIGKALNISDAEIEGVETSLSIDFLQRFSFTANYTRQDAVSRSAIEYADNKRLPGRYEHSSMARLEAAIGNGKIFYEVLQENGMYYDEAELLKALPKNLHNAGLSYRWNRFTATLEIRNITNDDYEDFHGYPQPGTAYYASLKFHY